MNIEYLPNEDCFAINLNKYIVDKLHYYSIEV